MSHPNDLAPRRKPRPGDLCMIVKWGKYTGAMVTAIIEESFMVKGIVPSGSTAPTWLVDRELPWQCKGAKIMTPHAPENRLWPLDHGDPGEDVAKKPQVVLIERLESGDTREWSVHR